jgi:hypothetical protein
MKGDGNGNGNGNGEARREGLYMDIKVTPRLARAL